MDAGCGTGRWAHELSRRGADVVAMDLGTSIEVAARNTAAEGVRCVQADVVDVPFQPATFDLVLSLGVLHHVQQTESALRAIVATLRPNGLILLYLYYALDNRPGWYRALFGLSDVFRRAISKTPQPATRAITSRVKELESQGYEYEAAEASLALLIRGVLDHNPELRFNVDSYHVSMRRDKKESICEATMRVRVGDKIAHTVAEGDGPECSAQSASGWVFSRMSRILAARSRLSRVGRTGAGAGMGPRL